MDKTKALQSQDVGELSGFKYLKKTKRPVSVSTESDIACDNSIFGLF
jgi:hypothetical protein